VELRRGAGAAGARWYGACLLACSLRRRRGRGRGRCGAVLTCPCYLPTYQPTYLHLSIHIYHLLLPFLFALTCPAAPTFPFPFASATPLASSAPPCADRASLALPALPQTQDADADADAGSNQTRLRRIAGRSRGASRIIGLRSAVSRAEDAWRALGRGERVDVWDGVSVSVSVSVSCRS
jgi:hypothetical protein